MSLEERQKIGSSVKVTVSKSGIPRKVFVDGIELPNVRRAQVKLEPQDLMILGVDITVADLQTVEEPDQ